jgi:hypothetical protein
MSDTELMQEIKTKWGGVITAVAATSSIVPEAFLAALIANEDGFHGGDPAAKRFEKLVLASLWEVLMGRKASYQGIGRADLIAYVAGVSSPIFITPSSLPADALQRIDGLATSWGLTQIMGWHVFDLGTTVEDLKTPAGNLKAATRLAVKYVSQFGLDVTVLKDQGELFDAWNTGRPDGVTFDPNYVGNGLARMRTYAALL